jgi:putative phosphoesterase
MPISKEAYQIGIISDTHGLLRPEALEALRGSRVILHAGDIGKQEIIEALEQIAPVTAVRGNIDREAWARQYPLTQVIEIQGIHLYILHDLSQLDLDPAASGFAAVISGHSHQAKIENKHGVFYINPGSAGPKRFRLPISVAKIEIKDGKVSTKILTLLDRSR